MKKHKHPFSTSKCVFKRWIHNKWLENEQWNMDGLVTNLKFHDTFHNKFFLKSVIAVRTLCRIVWALSLLVRIFIITPASWMKYSISAKVSFSLSLPIGTIHLLANWANLVRSEPNESSKSNNSRAGVGKSRNDGGNTWNVNMNF